METDTEPSEVTDNKQKPRRIRDEKGRMIFPPGVSGNPSGRPKGVRSFTTKVKEALEKIAEGKDFTYEEALVKTVMHKAIVDKDPAMIRLIWNYMDGLPHQSTDLTIGIKPIPIYSISDVPRNISDSQDSEDEEQN